MLNIAPVPGAAAAETAPAAVPSAEPRARQSSRRGGAGLFSLYRALSGGEAPAAGETQRPSRAARLLESPQPPAPEPPPAAPLPAEPPQAVPEAAPPACDAGRMEAPREETEPPLHPEQPREARRSRREADDEAEAGWGKADERLAEARRRKQFKRRVRGQDYEQVTVIFDRGLYTLLDARLAELEAESGGVKVSRSMLIRALLRRFVERREPLSLEGLFTPDPRSPEELEVVEAALVERLR